MPTSAAEDGQHSIRRLDYYYLIQWADPAEPPSWESAAMLDGCQALLKRFWARLPCEPQTLASLGHLFGEVIEPPVSSEGRTCMSAPYTCPCCTQSFTSAYGYQLHMATHSVSASDHPLQLTCNVCELPFNEPDMLVSHRLQHGDAPKQTKSSLAKGDRYKCEVCRAMLATAITLALHLRHHDFARELLWACDKCGMAFPSLARRRAHNILHDMENAEFLCLLCFQRRANAESLTRHMLRSHQAVSMANGWTAARAVPVDVDELDYNDNIVLYSCASPFPSVERLL